MAFEADILLLSSLKTAKGQIQHSTTIHNYYNTLFSTYQHLYKIAIVVCWQHVSYAHIQQRKEFETFRRLKLAWVQNKYILFMDPADLLLARLSSLRVNDHGNGWRGAAFYKLDYDS